MAPKKKGEKLTKEEKAAAAAAPEPAVVVPPPEAKKRKADEPAKEEPPPKDAKVEAEEEVKEDVNAEKEQDAPADKRAAIKVPVGFNTEDTTLNMIPALGDRVLTALSEGGVQYLIAGARANVGIKAGRYAFEMKVLEGRSWHQRPPRQVLRVGFSTAGSSLVLGDSDEHVAFDAEGALFVGKQRKPGNFKFANQAVTVVLNLDPKSPNSNTVSLFRDGVRAGQPQPLPESLHGKTLYPHISTRYATVQVNFGPDATKPLPFKCRFLSTAAAQDTEVRAAKTEQCEVVFPVALPDEGTFDWLDSWLAKNPHHVELSDRKLVQWAESSGMWKGNRSASWKNSNDKPDFNFGLPGMDDGSAQAVTHNIAPIVPRNYVVMEVKSNLVEAERKALLKKFSAPHFKKIAHVVIGEPSKEYKKRVLDKILKEKQDRAEVTWKAKKLEAERKKQLAEIVKKAEEAKKAAAEKKAAEDAAKKAAAGEETKMEVDAEGKEVEKKEEAPKEEAKEEKKEEEPKEEANEEPKEEVKEEPKEEVVEEVLGDTPPVVELSEEEKKLWFLPPKAQCTDLAQGVLKHAFASFSIPEAGEGFDEIRFEWQKDAQAKEYLRNWVLERKRTSRMEELVPGQWFQDKLKEWQKIVTDWQAKQKEYQETSGGKKVEKKEGTEEEKDAEMGDISSVPDVTDVGNGEPLFKDFTFEDWALLQLRYELYLLLRAFKKDVNDPDRVLHETHFGFYYNKYYRKLLSPQHFGAVAHGDLVAIVKDTVHFDDAKVLTTSLGSDLDDLDTFVKQTEEIRRARQRRLDAGDETARLKFSPLAMQKPGTTVAPPAPVPGEVPPPAPVGGKSGGKRYGGGKGKGGARGTGKKGW